jgi:hypothetical protein
MAIESGRHSWLLQRPGDDPWTHACIDLATISIGFRDTKRAPTTNPLNAYASGGVIMDSTPKAADEEDEEGALRALLIHFSVQVATQQLR